MISIVDFPPLLVYSADLKTILEFDSRAFPMYSPDEEIQEGDSVLIHDNLLSLKTKRVGSTGSTLQFSLPASDPKAAYLEVEKFVRFDDKLYIIKNVEDIHEGLDWRVSVYAERWWYAWTQNGTSVDINFDGYDAPSAVSYVVSSWMTDGVVWSPGIVQGTGIFQIDTSMGKSTMERLKEIEQTWGGYLQINLDTKTVDLLKDPGRDVGVVFTYDKDIKSITRTVDSSKLTTRLIPVRKDGSNIVSPSGSYYLYNYYWTNRQYDSVIEFDDDYDPNAAYHFAREQLKQLSVPTISYNVALSNIISPGRSYKEFDVLDKVSVMDRDFNRIVKARISELEIDYLEPQNSRMVLGNLLSNLSSTAPYIPPATQSTVPMLAPQDVIVSSEGYYDGEKPQSRVIVSWTPTESGADYLVELHPITERLVEGITSSTRTETFPNISPGEVVMVSICALGPNGRRSPWSDPVKVTAVGPSQPI